MKHIALSVTLAVLLIAAAMPTAAAPAGLSPLERAALADAVAAECGEYPFICKVAFAALVLNRVSDGHFPDSVISVLNDRGAFPRYQRGGAAADGECMASVYAAEHGFDPARGALFYGTGGDDGFIVTFAAGGMYFGSVALTAYGASR